MLVKTLGGHRIESADGFAVALRIAAKKMVRQHVDIFLALAQRRQKNVDGIEAKKQVLPKTARGGFRGYTHVGGGNHAHTHAASAGRADALELAGLENAQQLGLQLERNVRNFV